MTDLRKAAEMALEALESNSYGNTWIGEKSREAIEALRQALAQPEQGCKSTSIETISNAIDYLYSTGGEAKNIANQAHIALKQLQVNLRDQTVLHLLYKGDYEDLLAQPEQEPINKMPTKIFGPNLEEILNAAGFYRQPKQKPVAWLYNGHLHECDPSDWAESEVNPLYTAPVSKPWVSLTDEERVQAFADAGLELAYMDYDADMKISKVIEAKLREKNT